MNIYITGIDGAGKSSIIERLKTDFFKNEKVNVIWARYEPKLLKFIVKPFKKYKTSGSTNFNDMNEHQYNKWSSFKRKITKNRVLSSIIFLIQYIEYSFRINKVKRSISKSSGVTIVDRYILDFIVDQSVNHKLTKKNVLVKRMMSKLSMFDHIIFIDVDEDIAFKRKNDIPSIEYLSTRRKYYRDYVESLQNAFIVKNNTSIEEAILMIENEIK
jgi:thymidylate kinase